MEKNILFVEMSFDADFASVMCVDLGSSSCRCGILYDGEYRYIKTLSSCVALTKSGTVSTRIESAATNLKTPYRFGRKNVAQNVTVERSISRRPPSLLAAASSSSCLSFRFGKSCLY